MAEKKPGAKPIANLHERVKKLLETGALPAGPPVRTFAGYGDGSACLLCGGPIEPGERCCTNSSSEMGTSGVRSSTWLVTRSGNPSARKRMAASIGRATRATRRAWSDELS